MEWFPFSKFLLVVSANGVVNAWVVCTVAAKSDQELQNQCRIRLVFALILHALIQVAWIEWRSMLLVSLVGGLFFVLMMSYLIVDAFKKVALVNIFYFLTGLILIGYVDILPLLLISIAFQLSIYFYFKRLGFD